MKEIKTIKIHDYKRDLQKLEKDPYYSPSRIITRIGAKSFPKYIGWHRGNVVVIMNNKVLDEMMLNKFSPSGEWINITPLVHFLRFAIPIGASILIIGLIRGAWN